MMNLIAGVFTGLGMMLAGLFGNHAGTHPQMVDDNQQGDGHMASTSLKQHEDEMGTTTPGHMGTGKGVPGLAGKVLSINGSILMVSGRSDLKVGDATSTPHAMMATTTYSVDVSSAKLVSYTKKDTISLSSIKVGDYVLVIGTISGTTITATTVFDGIPKNPPVKMHPDIAASSTKSHHNEK